MAGKLREERAAIAKDRPAITEEHRFDPKYGYGKEPIFVVERPGAATWVSAYIGSISREPRSPSLSRRIRTRSRDVRRRYGFQYLNRTIQKLSEIARDGSK